MATIAVVTALRTADLTIRGKHGRQHAVVQWPEVDGEGTPAALMLFTQSWLDRRAEGDGAESLATAIREFDSVVSLCLRRRDATGYETAVSDAISAIEWVADHAHELDADAGRLIVGGVGITVDVVADVLCRIRANGWPSIAHQIFVDPPQPDGAAQPDHEGAAP